MTKLKKVGVLSFAKFQAVFMAFIGLIMGIFTAIMGVIYGAMLDSFRGGVVSVEGAELETSMLSSGLLYGMGFLGIIVLPVLYSLAGFIFGAIGAWLYNLIAKWIGGIEVEFAEKK